MSAPKDLMATFAFTEADLEANRSGTITAAQRERLAALGRSIRGASARTPWIVGGFVVFGLALMSAVYLVNSPQDFFLIPSNPSNLLALALAGLLIVGIVGYVVLRSRRLSAGLTGDGLKLMKTQGRAWVNKQTYLSQGRLRSSWAVSVGNKTFHWMQDTANQFSTGNPYCIYYCASGPYEQVLSIDRLDV
jgi:hypothetical protein